MSTRYYHRIIKEKHEIKLANIIETQRNNEMLNFYCDTRARTVNLSKRFELSKDGVFSISLAFHTIK
jgi:hypothetical protein